jgi:hypothetical protein
VAGKNYAAGQPVGDNQMPFNMQTPAPFKALKQYYSENGVTSSVITLTENTTAIEIGAGGSAVLMRWVYVADGTGAQTSVITGGATANWDHVIPAGQVRRFIVPIEVSNNGVQVGATITSQVGANIENGLFRRVAYRNTSIGSVFTSEYGKSNSY